MKKICVVLLSSALIIVLLCQPAFALLYTRSSTKWVLANSFGSSSAFLTSNDTVITSYDEWCDFYPEICDAVADGYYSGVDTSAIPFNRSFTYNGRQYLYIEIQINNWTNYLCNKSGGRFLYCSTGGTSTTPKPDLPEIELPTGTDYSNVLYSIAEYVSYISSCVENLSSWIRDTFLYVNNISVKVDSILSWLIDVKFSADKILQVVDDIQSDMIFLSQITDEVTNLDIALSSVISDGKLLVKDDSSFQIAVDIEKLVNGGHYNIGADDDPQYYRGVAQLLEGIYSYTYTINDFIIPIHNILSNISSKLDSVISDGKLIVDNSSIVNKIDEYFGGSEKRKGIYYWASINYANLSLATSHLFEAKSALAHIRDSLDSVISDGTLKVDNTSVVTAIQSLESALSNLNVTATFDDSNVIKAVNTVDATLDTRLLQVYNSAERLRTTVSEGNTIQRGILNVVSTSDATLSDISAKLDMQNDYYTELDIFYGSFEGYFTSEFDLINSIDGQVSWIRQLLQKPLAVTTDFSPIITSVDAVGVNIEDLNANFNTNIGSLLDKLDIVIEGSSESLENRINVTIDASNDAHNVFYVTGEDGEEQSVTEFTGDLTKASGRLLSLLYRLVFADALSTVDGDLDGFEDFFTSQGDDTATLSMESPSEEENVWLVS